jgi:hypothetical protein
MKRMTAMLSAAAVVILTAGLIAQAHPSFAGKWAREAAAAPAGDQAAQGGRGGRGGRGGFGQAVTITQDTATITMEYEQGGQNPTPVKRVYKLDGSDSTNTMTFGGNSVDQVSKATWEGSKLVITTTSQMGETRQVLSMNGADLNVEETRPGRQGGAPTTTTVVYKKAM